LGWFWDKKKSSKKIFVYSHIVPVDIHTVIHSSQPLFGAGFQVSDELVYAVIMLAMRLMSPWPGTGGNLKAAQQPCMDEERQTLVTKRGGETRRATA